MCATENVKSTQSSEDWLVIHEQAPHLIRADPVTHAKPKRFNFISGLFGTHKNVLVSMGSNESQLATTAANNDGWIAVEPSKPAPIYVRSATDLVRDQVNEKYLRDYKAYNLRAYKYSNNGTDLYLKIELNPYQTPTVYAYVSFHRPTETSKWNVVRIENFDFKSRSNNIALNHTVLATTVHCLRWTNVTSTEPAPEDIETVTFLARESIETQRRCQLCTCDLIAYKKVPKENGDVIDFYLKMNIVVSGTPAKRLFVKVVADHGHVNYVVTDYHDFSPNVLS